MSLERFKSMLNLLRARLLAAPAEHPTLAYLNCADCQLLAEDVAALERCGPARCWCKKKDLIPGCKGERVGE